MSRFMGPEASVRQLRRGNHGDTFARIPGSGRLWLRPEPRKGWRRPNRCPRDLLNDADRRRYGELGRLRLEREQLRQQGEYALGVGRAMLGDAVVAIDKPRMHKAL